MAGNKVRGIIIRKTNYSESDVIFDVLSEEGEIIGFFGRSARKMKSKFAGVLQMGLVVSVTYSTGKNLNYPNEITLDKHNLFSFYSKSLQHMNFYTDVLSLLKIVSKDLKEPLLFDITLAAFQKAQQGDDIVESYNEFMDALLELIGVESELRCHFSGELINEPEFYYSPDTNRVISTARKPNSIDIPLISNDKYFHKQYVQKLMLEHVNHKLKLKF